MPEPAQKLDVKPFLAACSAAAAVCVAHANAINSGNYAPAAVVWLAAGIALAWLGLIIRPASIGRLAPVICIVGLLWEVEQGITGTKAIDRLLLFAAVLAILIRPYRRTVFIPILLVAHFLVGVRLLKREAPPMIDVYEVCKDSCQALAAGRNPYTIDFPDVYANRPDWQKEFYPPGLVVNGRAQFGYPYMPLDLLVEFAGQEIGGDYRFATLLAITAAGAFLAYCGSSGLSVAAAALLLLMPKGFYVVQQGWVDPIIVCALAAAVFIASRRPAWLPFVVGLFLVTKQHMFLAVPGILLLLPERKLRFVLIAAITGSVITLPLFLWNVHAFWHSAFAVQLACPFRYDALSFSAAWARAGHAPPPDSLAFIVAVVAALVAFRAPRGAAGFAIVTSIVFLCFFATAKQAFFNYYFFAASALCSTVAASAREQANPMLGNRKIVVVLPAYRAEKTLEATYRDIPKDIVDEVILVDDASPDETVDVARRLGIHTIIHAENRGYGGNQKTCYAEALRLGADIVVMLHPDYQYDPRLIPAMAGMLVAGVYDIVLGSRILGGTALRSGMPLYKYISNRLLTACQNLLLGSKLSEFHTGYRAFSKTALERLPLAGNSDDFVFDNQILAQAFALGLRVGEISCPTRYFAEASSINFRRSVRYGLGVLATSLKFRLWKMGLAKPRMFAGAGAPRQGDAS